MDGLLNLVETGLEWVTGLEGGWSMIVGMGAMAVIWTVVYLVVGDDTHNDGADRHLRSGKIPTRKDEFPGMWE